jgi:hypothetical protein
MGKSGCDEIAGTQRSLREGRGAHRRTLPNSPLGTRNFVAESNLDKSVRK